MKTKREEIAEFEELFNNALIDNSYCEKKYTDISNIIEFLQRCIENINPESFKQGVLIVGSSGAGKSTLMNDLVKENNLVIAENSNGELMLQAVDSVSVIGQGGVSTTLIPTTVSPPHMTGVFFDCAGEGDTSGIVTRALLSLIKLSIAKNIEEVKLLLVASQVSLGQEAGYGRIFKEALDVNAQFLNDINDFKDSIAFIVSHAERNARIHTIAKNLIKNILVNHPNIGRYKEAIAHLLEKEEAFGFSRISTFSKPSSEISQIGELYKPLVLIDHPPQRDKIINMVEKLPFTKIPSPNFFKVSFDNDVKCQMGLALDIVVNRAGDLIANILQSNLKQVKIYSVELKPFKKYFNGLMNSSLQTDLEHFLRILQWNDYFKVSDDDQIEAKKLNQQMKFLSQFTEQIKSNNEKEDQEKYSIKVNWLVYAKMINKKIIEMNSKEHDISEDLDQINQQLEYIFNMKGNHFSKFLKNNEGLSICSAFKDSTSVQESLQLLYNSYKEKEQIEMLRNDQTSKYHREEMKQEFDYNEIIQYEETEEYVNLVDYWEKEQYVDIEYQSKTVTKFKPVKRSVTPEKTTPIFIEEDVFEMVPYTKYRTETYTETQCVGTKRDSFLFFKYNRRRLYETVTKTREVPYTEYKKEKVGTKKVFQYNKTEKDYSARKIEQTDMEPYQETERVATPVTKFRDVLKQRPVKKERQVQKEKEQPVFKDLIVKVFDEELYQTDLKQVEEQILQIKESIIKVLDEFKYGSTKFEKEKEEILSKDKIEKEYVDLRQQWLNAEYGSYFVEKPNSILEELELEAIEDQCKK